MKFFSSPLVWLSSSFFLFVVSFFLVAVPAASSYYLVSFLFILLLSLPAFLPLIRSWGFKRALFVFVLLGSLAFVVESVGVLTGLPYGAFFYDASYAWLLGVVPFSIFFSWSPLVISASALHKRFFVALLALVFFDVVFDPVAAAIGFWVWPVGGWWFGVPLSNYLGWFVSGAIGLFFLRKVAPKSSPRVVVFSGWLFLSFASWSAFFLGLFVPALLGIFGLVVLWLWFFKK